MHIQLKRIYDDPEPSDGYRVLVDRLWPRGVSKEAAKLDGWLKELTPSDELRKWYHEDKEQRWEEFKTAYREELAGREEAMREALDELRGREKVTFLFAAKIVDSEGAGAARTHAKVLRDVVIEKRGT
ncbi:MAG: DUF488 family protein [Balneolaceae bacterium]|nr:DUF488 family protein [Balneolaceae bacterium]